MVCGSTANAVAAIFPITDNITFFTYHLHYYRSCLHTLHSQAVVEEKTNFVPNRVLRVSPPNISPVESLLPRSVHTTLAQLHFGYCWLLNIYNAHINSGISDVCRVCAVTPHSIEHLLNCQSQPMQLTVHTF